MAEKKKLTPEERKKVAAQIADLQAALDEVEDAEGAKEEAAAKAELEKERAATAALFSKLDLTEEDYDLLVKSLAAGTEDRTREIVREELGEEPGSGEGEGNPEAGGLGELQEDPGAPPNPAPQPPEDPPISKHWTEKRFGWGQDAAPGEKV
jgi:hypothetical protein